MSDVPVGRELDALVARDVFGLEVHTEPIGFMFVRHGNTDGPVMPYSTDIAAAWMIVEKLGLSLVRMTNGNWWAGRFREGTYFSSDVELGVVDGNLEDGAEAPTAPEAICRAALAAVAADRRNDV